MRELTVRQARESAKLTQQQLAERSGIDQSTISDLETGRHNNPRLTTVRRLADALGIAPSRLRFSEPEPAAKVRQGGDRVGQDRKGRSSRRAVA